MIPGVPVISLLVAVQVVNGALLPIKLFFIWRLARDPELMGEHRNGPVFDGARGGDGRRTSRSRSGSSSVTLTGNA